MKMLRFWVPLVALAGFLALSGYMLTKPKSEFVESRMIGQSLPYFALPAAVPDRPGLSNKDFATGKPRLLNIFASWCLPCAAEAPHLAELAARGADITGVAIRDRPEDVAAFLARHGNPFTRIGQDPGGRMMLAFGASGVPETYVVDGRGVIRYQHLGEIRPEHVDLLLAELEKAK